MAHQIRFMHEVRPGTWVIQCRICPKRSGPSDSRIPAWASYRGGKATFDNAGECHDWWREHASSEMHQTNNTPAVRERQRRRQVHDRNLGSISEMADHWKAGCEFCS